MAKKIKSESLESNNDSVVITPQKVKELVVLDLKEIALNNLKELASDKFEISSVKHDDSISVEIVSLANKYVKNTPCGKASITDGLVIFSLQGKDTEHVIKKPDDTLSAARIMLSLSINYLLELSKEKRKTELEEIRSDLFKKVDKDVNCFIENLDEDAYHSGPGVSNSMLSELDKSCKHLDYRLATHKEPTDDMKLGSALHDLVLRPELFDELNYLAPDISKVSNEGKFVHLLSSLVNFGKRDLSEKDLSRLKRAESEVLKHPTASLIVKEGLKELSFYCKIQPSSDHDPIIMRGRADGLIVKPSKQLIDKLKEQMEIPDNAIIVYDLKFLRDNGDEAEQIGKIFYNSGYHRQAYNYQNMVERLTDRLVVFIFVTVSKDGTYDVVPYQLDSAAMELGQIEIERLQEKYVKEFLRKDTYRGRSTEVMSIGFPQYVYSKKSLN